MGALTSRRDDIARDQVARQLAEFAAEAGDVLTRFRTAACRQGLKADGSPVSEADLAAEVVLTAQISEAYPQWPIISEENALSHASAPKGTFFLVDPLDGTKAFLAGGPDFCVLVALIRDGVPVASAIHAPVSGQSWWAGTRAFKARDRRFSEIVPLSVYPVREGGQVAIVSSEHASEKSRALCEELRISRVVHENSTLKFVRLAEGEADLYPRIGRTMQWDIAAGDGLIRALGGMVVERDGHPLRYGAREGKAGAVCGWENPDFIAFRRKEDRQ